MDQFSKSVHFIPTNTDVTAEGIIELLICNIIANHGCPSSITSDRGSIFANRFMEAFATSINAKLKRTTAYHPQSNGQAERLNDVVAHYLRNYVSHRQHNWSPLLPWAQLAYNTTEQTSTRLSPFHATYGFTPPSSFDLASLPLPSYVPQPLPTVWTKLTETVNKSKAAYARFQNQHRTTPPAYKVGDEVLLDTSHLPPQRPSRKLSPRRQGPFKILKVLSENTIQLELPPHWKQNGTYDIFHVEKLTPYTSPSIQTRRSNQPSTIIDDVPLYNVAAVHDSKVHYSTIKYLVEYDDLQRTTRWEPLDSLLTLEEDGIYCITEALKTYIQENPNCVHDVPPEALFTLFLIPAPA